MDSKQAHKDIRVTFRRAFESEDGKKVLKYLETFCFMNASTFNADPYKSAFNEGARSVILHINSMRGDDGLQKEEET